MQSSTKIVNPNNGYCSETRYFHSLRPPLLLPPETTPTSATSFALSLRRTSPFPDSTTALIDSATARRLSYSDFIRKSETLASSLHIQIGLSKGDTAFILSPNSTLVPILYFSLLSIGVVVSPANPASTESEVSRLIKLSKSTIAFATSSTCHKLPPLKRGTVILDSAEFESMLTSSASTKKKLDRVEVSQADVAAIMYTSGTTGMAKGVMLTHRNLTAIVAGYHAQHVERAEPAVMLYTMPYFHVFGLYYSLKSVALGESVVVMERFDLGRMVRAVEEFGVTHVAVGPPAVAAMGKGGAAKGRELSSLEGVLCGGSSLVKDVITAFNAKFPRAVVYQVSY